MADAPKSVVQAATQVDHELSRQLIDKILSGGTESTLALLLAVALIALGACVYIYRKADGNFASVIEDLKARNDELEQELKDVRAECEARVEAERNRSDREVSQARSQYEQASASFMNEYKTLLTQCTTSIQSLTSAMQSMRDTINSLIAARTYQQFYEVDNERRRGD